MIQFNKTDKKECRAHLLVLEDKLVLRHSYMKLSSWLMNTIKGSPDGLLPDGDRAEELSAMTPEELWDHLCQQPNQGDKLEALLVICRSKGGQRAMDAALLDLCQIRGSYLPQMYLAKEALRNKDLPAALAYYNKVLTIPSLPEQALFLMATDLGQYGYAKAIPELLLPHYKVKSHSPYLGLNILQAFAEIKDAVGGRELLMALQQLRNPEIQSYLDDFSKRFAQIEKSSRVEPPIQATPVEPSVSLTPPIHGDDSLSPSQVDETATQPEMAPASVTKKDIDYKQVPFLVALETPAWSYGFPGIEALLPSLKEKKRVGVYMYANTSEENKASDLPAGIITPADLALSLPLFMGERLLFTSQCAPVVLLPVSYENGPQRTGLEPDVQGLFGLCAREKLDFVIAGTIFQDAKVYRIRTWILDKSNQSARIVAKDIPFNNFAEPFAEMINELALLFQERRGVKPEGNAGIYYTIPDPKAILCQLKAEGFLLYQHLVRKNYCLPALLPQTKEMLNTYCELSSLDPKSQLYFMILLSGLQNNYIAGSKEYQNFRPQLYQVADKNRHTPCVKACFAEINGLLKDET